MAEMDYSVFSPYNSRSAMDAAYAEFINLGDLPGAKGDGIVDNTTIFQAALDRVGNDTPFVRFFLPEGVWLTDGLRFKSNTTIEGVGPGTFGLNSFNATRTSVLKLKNNASRALITDYATDNLSYGITVRNLQLDGNKLNQVSAIRGIEQYPAASGQDPLWQIENVYLHDFKGDAIYVGSFRRAIQINNCQIINNDGHGINIDATDCTVSFCKIGQNLLDGIRYTNGLQHCNNNDIWGNTNGISLGSLAQHAMITNNGIDINRRHGITTAAPRTVITGNSFQTNGIETHNTYSHIDLDFPNLTAIGCVVAANAMRHDNTQPNKAKYGIQTNLAVAFLGVAFNPADVPWVSGLTGDPALLALAFRSQSFLDGTVLHTGSTNGVTLGATGNKLAFLGATPIVRPSGTPTNATDLATVIALSNDLKAKLIALGLIA